MENDVKMMHGNRVTEIDNNMDHGGIRNVKPERRWADKHGDSEHDPQACILTEGEEKGY
jgi:hypothetical protein